jgi:NADH-quinone oxidoreductase subunit L
MAATTSRGRPGRQRLLTRAARKDLYQDDLNEGLFMRPGIAPHPSVIWTDNELVDGAFEGLATFTGGIGHRLRVIQNGFARSYALTMLTGVVVILGALWVMN